MKNRLFAVTAILLLTSCAGGTSEKHTPLEWCVKEVMSNYATEYPYSYSKINYPEGFYDYDFDHDNVKDYSFVDCYEIHVFVDDPSVWATDYYYCGIFYNDKKSTFAKEEIKVDCDFLYSIAFE